MGPTLRQVHFPKKGFWRWLDHGACRCRAGRFFEFNEGIGLRLIESRSVPAGPMDLELQTVGWAASSENQ